MKSVTVVFKNKDRKTYEVQSWSLENGWLALTFADKSLCIPAAEIVSVEAEKNLVTKPPPPPPPPSVPVDTIGSWATTPIPAAKVDRNGYLEIGDLRMQLLKFSTSSKAGENIISGYAVALIPPNSRIRITEKTECYLNGQRIKINEPRFVQASIHLQEQWFDFTYLPEKSVEKS